MDGVFIRYKVFLFPRDKAVSFYVKSQKPPGPMPGISHTNPRPPDDCKSFILRGCGDIEIITEQVVPIEASVDVHCLA